MGGFPNFFAAKKGFTLLELMVVMAILAIIVVVGISIYSGIQKNAQDTEKRLEIAQIAKTQELNYDSASGMYQPINGSDFSGGTIPTPPEGGNYAGILAAPAPAFGICATLQGDPAYPGQCFQSSTTCACVISQHGTYVQPSPSPSPTTTPLPTPTGTPGPTPSPTPAPCNFTSAVWNTPLNPITQNNTVYLDVVGNGSCSGEVVKFDVWEDDAVSGEDFLDDPVGTNPANVSFLGNTASAPWTTEYQCDGFSCTADPPEYYFIASLVSNPATQLISSAPELEVNQSLPDTTPPTVALTNPANGANISGTVNVTANATDNIAVAYVDFFVDGIFKGTDNSDPYSYSLDTTTLADGAHTISAKAVDTSTNPSTTDTVNVTVDNFQPIAYRTSITATNGSGATSITIPVPAGVQNNDVMIAQILVRGNNTLITSVPAGWIFIIRTNNGTNFGTGLYLKVASSESGSYVFGFASSVGAVAGITAFSSVDTTSPIVGSNGQALNSTNITAPQVDTTGVPNSMLIYFASIGPLTTVNPPTSPVLMTEVYDTTGPASSTIEAAYALFSSAGPTGTRTGTIASAMNYVAQLIALKPQP